MSRTTARAGGSWRFAGRSLGRTRARSAAVVTAIAVTVAAGVVAISAISGVVDAGSNSPWPTDAVVAPAYPAAVYQPSNDIDGTGTVDFAPISPTEVERHDPGADHGDRSVRPLVPPAGGHVGSAGRGGPGSVDHERLIVDHVRSGHWHRDRRRRDDGPLRARPGRPHQPRTHGSAGPPVAGVVVRAGPRRHRRSCRDRTGRADVCPLEFRAGLAPLLAPGGDGIDAERRRGDRRRHGDDDGVSGSRRRFRHGACWRVPPQRRSAHRRAGQRPRPAAQRNRRGAGKHLPRHAAASWHHGQHLVHLRRPWCARLPSHAARDRGRRSARRHAARGGHRAGAGGRREFATTATSSSPSVPGRARCGRWPASRRWC